MAAPRATQFIALRNLSRGSQQVRSLHMTGPATYASAVLAKESPISNLPRDIAGLRAECKRRKIEASGLQQDLLRRLQAHDLTNSRSFSTATTTNSTPVRHFNTSRTLKAVHDSSTIDFAYLPSVADLSEPPEEILRVPILPDNYTASSPQQADEDVIVMKPEISTMSADAVYLPMAEMSDDHAMNIDFHALADRVSTSVRRLQVGGTVGVEEQASIMKQVWSDMVDDLTKAIGGKKILG